jgi:capsid assembly protein Gp20/intein-like protein with splicing domain
MASREPKSLFRRLTRLFRSGPVVKRKIRALDTTIAIADKTKSSGTLLFQKSLSPTYATITSNAYNLSERLMRYQDFQEMEYTPEIAAALDIYADETVAADEKGRCLHVYSDNEKIRELLEDMFYNVLNIEFNLRLWARNLCKYGDFFLYNDVSPEYGVINAFPIPVNEIEREENYDRDDPFAVRYRWVTLGNRTLENWEVTHFRLLGNDMFLPYGSSIIEPARRIWRQLILIEDAMLVYRVVRAPERRVFYIDVANVPPNEVPQYVEQQRQAMRTTPVVDRHTGRVDLRYNPMCLTMDACIKLQDGRSLRLDELISERAAGKQDQWVYSVDVDGKRLVPGKVAWAGVTRKDAELVRVTLDDGTWRDTTPDHRFMLRDGCYKQAQDLVAGEQLMPLYTKVSSKLDGDAIVGYEKVYDPFSETYKFTHRINAEFCDTASDVIKNAAIHHVDFDKLNNDPSNLQRMNYVEHRRYHAQHCDMTLNSPEQLAARGKRLAEWNRSADKLARVSARNIERNSVAAMAGYNGSELHASHNASRSASKKQMWADPARKEHAKHNMRYVMTDAMFERLVNVVKQDQKAGRVKVHAALMNDPQFVAGLQEQALGRDVKKYSTAAWEGELVRRGYAKLSGFRASIAGYKNHQVVSVERLSRHEDTGCITVEKYHNFMCGPSAECLVSLGEAAPSNSWISLHNSVEEDFFIPVRGGESGTKIDTLAGGQNTAAVEDVAYIQKKLFAALKIPRAYLGYDEMLCLTGDTQVALLDGTTVSMADLALKGCDDTWVYSCDPATGAIVPGRVTKAWKTKDVAELYVVTLDDGTVIKCTANHPFLCRDGTYQRAGQLVAGQSLMPLYRKLSSRAEGDFQDGYEKCLDNSTGKWEFTHRIVNEAGLVGDHPSRALERSYVVHHVDHHKRNNFPSNLTKMGKQAHAKHHSLGAEANLLTKTSRDKLRTVMQTDEYAAVHLAGVQQAWDNATDDRRQALATWNSQNKRKDIGVGTLEALARGCTDRRGFAQALTGAGVSWTCFRNNLNRAGVVPSAWLQQHFGGSRKGIKPTSSVTVSQLKEHCINHGISSMVGWRRSQNAPVSGAIVMRTIREAGFQSFSQFVSTFKCNHKVVSVQVLQLSSPAPVYDLTVEGCHNFAIGTGTVDGGDASFVMVHNSSKATLAQEDIRFSRTISVIQKTMMAELNKLAIIHLYAHGFDNEDLQNFTLRLSNPSTVAQQQKLELWRAKFEIAGSAPEGTASKKFIRKEIWGLNEEQIEQMDDERLKEKLVDAAIEGAGGGEEAGGEGGDDLFGGGGEEGGGAGGDEMGAGDAGGDETPPEENAGETPEEEKEPETELLTGGDDRDDDESFSLKLQGINDKPVKVQSQLDKVLYNRGRRRTHGASKTHMPDFVKMTGNDGPSMEDPYDNDWIKSVVKNPFEEGIAPARRAGGKLSYDMVSMLERMHQRHYPEASAGAGPGVLLEGKDVQDEIDKGSLDLDFIESRSSTSERLNESEVLIVEDDGDEYDTGDDE